VVAVLGCCRFVEKVVDLVEWADFERVLVNVGLVLLDVGVMLRRWWVVESYILVLFV